MCSAPFAKLTFIYSPAAGNVAFYCYRLLQGSGGGCTPAIPPPLSGTAFKRLPLCTYVRVIRRVPTHYALVKNSLMPSFHIPCVLLRSC